ncbi:MAG: DNA-directed RNA polymerase subunit alpha C-terminal domain-containing protein, partial [Chloroflexota bacterium]|nr:DNA-directed RNA polymerase subunit alpha C-terminal domain-containing protein [Chloroflexota bacterium]
MDKSPNLTSEQPSPDLPITEIGISTRARNVLLGADISTVGDVLAALAKGDEALTRLKGFGPKSLADLKKWLYERGLPHPSDPVPPLQALEMEIDLEKVQELETPKIEMGSSTVETAPEEATTLEREFTPRTETRGEEPSFGQRFGAARAQPRQQFRVVAWLYGLVGLALVLLLLSASLLNRLGITGYTPLDAEDSSASHPDGITLSVSTETFADQL